MPRTPKTNPREDRTIPAISVNGKFLGASLNGVHRTAALYAAALMAHRSKGMDIEVVAPRPLPEDHDFRTLKPRVVPSILGTGQAWEMIALPMATRNRLLINLCNLAPILHANSVVMIHDAQTYLYPEDYSGRQATAYRMLLPQIARRALRVLTVSEYAKTSLVANGVADREKIVVVHNGADHLLAVKPDNTVLSTRGLRPSGYALALGTTKSYKNIARLFAAFDCSALKDLPLVIAGGPGPQSYADSRSVLSENLIFLGNVTDSELRALYTNAAMFLFPSRTEGFGLPPVEAMTCGCPVIAARAGAMPEICGDGALLVDPEDTEAWRKAILDFRDPANRARYSEPAMTRARHFTWDRAGARLWDAIGDLAIER